MGKKKKEKSSRGRRGVIFIPLSSSFPSHRLEVSCCLLAFRFCTSPVFHFSNNHQAGEEGE
jgi:hypothetical protein